MKKNDLQLSQLVDMYSPEAVFEEVKYNFIQFYPIAAFQRVRATFKDFNRLFEGKYPGYKACNTKFHDKIHTSDALLVISRLIDGYNLKHEKLPLKQVTLALIATIFHDAGYIQQKGDKKGTGAKFTLCHIDRSIHFMEKYFSRQGYSKQDFLSAARIVRCTGLSVDVNKIKFASPAERLLGFMLGSADLLGQMGARTYLERLFYLYREFKEGHIEGYTSALVLLKKTLKFYEGTKERLNGTLGGVNKFLVEHFKERYAINEDLYKKSIDRQMNYLEEILKSKNKYLHEKLRRRI